MKILWLCNIVLPELSDVFGFKKQNIGGWISGAWTELKKCSELELAICVPVNNPERVKDGVYENYTYYSFLTISGKSDTTVENQIYRFKEIINDFKPDVIHVWGTEFAHSYSMVKAAEALKILDNVVVNIQGYVFYIGRKYSVGIDYDTYYDDIGGRSIYDDEKSFMRNSENEVQLLTLIKNISGRTEFDFAVSHLINPQLRYFKIGEILRQSFYTSKKWNYEACRKHSIFLSQAFYPIKGLHLVIEELCKLKNSFPDLLVEIGGTELDSKNSPYGHYIYNLLEEYHLVDTIKFIGKLDEKQMVEKYLSTNVFLSPSIMENSSNSICEAMMLGVPVVASYVGGTPSLIEHGKSGYMYPLNEPEMMRYYVELIFGNKDISELSKREIEKAEIYNSKEKSVELMMKMYNKLIK